MSRWVRSGGPRTIDSPGMLFLIWEDAGPKGREIRTISLGNYYIYIERERYRYTIYDVRNQRVSVADIDIH